MSIRASLGETGKELHYETGAHAGDIGIDLVCGIGELSSDCHIQNI